MALTDILITGMHGNLFIPALMIAQERQDEKQVNRAFYRSSYKYPLTYWYHLGCLEGGDWISYL